MVSTCRKLKLGKGLKSDSHMCYSFSVFREGSLRKCNLKRDLNEASKLCEGPDLGMSLEFVICRKMASVAIAE